jgi:hypothetical protein
VINVGTATVVNRHIDMRIRLDSPVCSSCETHPQTYNVVLKKDGKDTGLFLEVRKAQLKEKTDYTAKRNGVIPFNLHILRIAEYDPKSLVIPLEYHPPLPITHVISIDLKQGDILKDRVEREVNKIYESNWLRRMLLRMA